MRPSNRFFPRRWGFTGKISGSDFTIAQAVKGLRGRRLARQRFAAFGGASCLYRKAIRVPQN
jgi:hypothetical protein